MKHIDGWPFFGNLDPNQARRLFKCPGCEWELWTYRPPNPERENIEAHFIEETVTMHELTKHGIEP